jgi:hypothetical protein
MELRAARSPQVEILLASILCAIVTGFAGLRSSRLSKAAKDVSAMGLGVLGSTVRPCLGKFVDPPRLDAASVSPGSPGGAK